MTFSFSFFKRYICRGQKSAGIFCLALGLLTLQRGLFPSSLPGRCCHLDG